MFNIGTPELLVILIIALVIVGPRRLPEIGRQVGKGLREFRKVQDEVRDMVKFDLNLAEDHDDDLAPPVPEAAPKPVPTPHRTRVHTDPASTPSVNGDGPVSDEAPSAEPTGADEPTPDMGG